MADKPDAEPTTGPEKSEGAIWQEVKSDLLHVSEILRDTAVSEENALTELDKIAAGDEERAHQRRSARETS